MRTESFNLASGYMGIIEWIGDGTGLPDTILHIHAGMAVLLLARLCIRKSLATFIPLYFVIAAELGNEVMDRIYYGSWRWPDTILDVINTLLWPIIISLAVRLRPPIDHAGFRSEIDRY